MNYFNEVKPIKTLGDFPRGWFRVAYSDELTLGKVMALRYFERDLVLWRSQDNRVQILDAHCPRLASRRDRILSYSEILPQAQTNPWSVVEANGTIFMYYHPSESALSPDWTIPELPEFADSNWTQVMRRRWRVHTSVYEIAENGVDHAHSPYVHAQTFADLKSEGFNTNGTTSINRLSFITKLLGKETEADTTITSYGLGCQVSQTIVKAFIELQFTAIFLITPIDRQYSEINLVFTMKKLANRQLTRLSIAPLIMQGIGKTLEQDIPIWENKIFRNNPLLCDGDGPISQYRRWARQFYQ